MKNLKWIPQVANVLKLIVKYGAFIMIIVETVQFLTDKLEKQFPEMLKQPDEIKTNE